MLQGAGEDTVIGNTGGLQFRSVARLQAAGRRALEDLEKGGPLEMKTQTGERLCGEAEGPAEVRGYVSSLTGRGDSRRLHFVGRCLFKLWSHYMRFICHGAERPGPAEYDAVWGRCWPSANRKTTELENSSVDTEAGSSLSETDE